MTDVLLRPSEPAGGKARSGRPRFELSGSSRVLLAVLSAAAGIIHLAMVPSHWGESVVEGFGFAVVGWAQLALAVALFVRPTAALLRAGMVATLSFVAVWVISRAWGLPFGEHAGHPHDPSFIDLVCVGIEVAFIAAAGFVLSHPGLGRGRDRARFAVAAVASIAVVALATAALASPSARDHAAASHAAHDHAEGATVAAADDHSDTAANVSAHHTKASAADVASGFAALGENGHQHGAGVIELDNATQAALSVQLAQTSRLTEKYPTLAAAEAAGYRRQGRFNPGLGTHYGGFRGDGIIIGVEGQPMVPTLIYDGTDPDSPLAGFMYSAPGAGGQVPEGFVGPNDHWHKHSNLCIVMKNGVVTTPLGADDPTITKEKCDAVPGGFFVAQSGYMVHVWTVPGYESPDGVFSGINRKVTCPDGTYHKATDGGTPTSTCKNA